MTTIINGSSPSITFSDSTTQSTGISSVNPVFTGDASISGLTVGKGASAVSTNTVVGSGALAANTSGSLIVAVGTNALAANTTGAGGTAVGREALKSNTTGDWNTAVGINALTTNSTGAANTAVGQNALQANTTAGSNTAVGYQAGYSNQTGSNSAMFGYQAGYTGTDLDFTVAVGYRALYNATGDSNVAIGPSAGTNTTTGGNNIFIGRNVNGSAGGNSYEIVIGYDGQVGKGGSTGFITPGGGSMYQGNNSSSWATTSDFRLKKNIVDNKIGLEVVKKVQVRNFEYRLPEEVTDLDASNAVDIQGVQLGVIAQELQQILPESIKEETTGVLRVDTDNLFWHMVNAIQELKTELDATKAEVEALKDKP